MDTLRIAEHLAEGGVFTDEQARRIATTLADHATDELATKQDLAVLKAELKSEFKSDLASVRNQLLATQAATFLGILLYITLPALTSPTPAANCAPQQLCKLNALLGSFGFSASSEREVLLCQSHD